MRGAGEAAGRGVLIRTGEAFQALRKVTTVVFDKTGTLTEGKPVLREVEPHGISEDLLIFLAAAVEAASEHPLAQAVVQAAVDVNYRKMLQNISLAFLFNGIGIPLAATGLIHPVWAMAAMAVSVTAIFVISLAGRSGLFFGAVGVWASHGLGRPGR